MRTSQTKRAAQTKTARRYVAMCVPGRTDADAGAWFVYDREQLRSEPAANGQAAQRAAAAKNVTQLTTK